MNLAADRLTQLDNPTLTTDERVLIRCQAVADLILTGQFEAAREAMSGLWGGVGQRPPVQGLGKEAAAEVLLQCGVLSSAIGSARNLSGAQESAKDLISEAQWLFESLDLRAKAVEAQYELSVCYWRLGAFDNARAVLINALDVLGSTDSELAARIFIRRSMIETWACRYRDALDILKEAEPYFSALSDLFKARWHGLLGSVLRHLGTAEGRADYLDRAIIENTAAVYIYEKTGHERYCAVNLNNRAMLFYLMGRYQDAHESLDRAAKIFLRLRDPGNLAQVNETRARVLLEEGRLVEARAVIESVIEVFEQGGEQSCLADALTIRATVLARTGEHDPSIETYRRAMDVAADAGALEKAGHAALSLIEEHGLERLGEVEIYETFCRADELLRSTQDMEDIRRLRACARLAARKLLGAQLCDPGFSLPEAVRAYEARFIHEALDQSEGSVTRAARLLGISHHSTLAAILERRHQQLSFKRTPVTPRRRSIIRKPVRKLPRAACVLHVEDNRLVAETVCDMLKLDGYHVESCADGAAALRLLSGNRQFDLLIIDNNLPGADGIEVVRRARGLRHRRRMPIIMLTASEAEAEAWRAGVDAFLRKPDDLAALADNVKRLLRPSHGKD